MIGGLVGVSVADAGIDAECYRLAARCCRRKTLARWDDLPGLRNPNVKITAGAVAAVVMTAMLFVIMFALMIAI